MPGRGALLQRGDVSLEVAAEVLTAEELERLAIEMYARGLSVRDIEATFTDEDGRCALSKSAASQVAGARIASIWA